MTDIDKMVINWDIIRLVQLPMLPGGWLEQQLV